MVDQKVEPIFLWAVPRSVSTAFMRAMECRSDTKVIMEPYLNAFYFGEERKNERFADFPQERDMSFMDVRKELEDAKSDLDSKILFVKDMAYYIIRGQEGDPLRHIPDGFQHTFLIRHPKKSILSLYKITLGEMTGWSYFDPNETGYKELWELYCLLRAKLERPPLVIDADDLLNNPEPYLRAYCEWIGLPYEESMLKWSHPEKSVLTSCGMWMKWVGKVLQSETLEKPIQLDETALSAAPDSIRKCIDDNFVYYQHLQEVALKLKV